MADSTLTVNLNLTPAAFASAWSDYLVTKVTTGPYTVASHAATRHLGPTQNFVENCLLQFQEKTAKTILNVREYGALGDGATDDAAAIQAALDAADALGGASVYLGAGVFVINSALTIYDGTQLIGAGQQDTTIQYTSTGYAMVQSTPETRIYGVRLEGFSMTFDAGGLDLNSISRSLFLDLHLQANTPGTGTCARVQSTAVDQGEDNSFIACHFQAGAVGLQLGTGGANRNRVIGCIAEDCTTGILITDGASNLVQGCTILDNTTGIQISESGGVLSQGNHIDACMFDEQVTRNINIATAGIDNSRVTNNFFVTAPSADVNNGTNTFASGNLPLAAPWGVLYSDVASIDASGVATFSGFTPSGDILPAADSTYDLGAAGNEWAELHVDSAFIQGTTTVGGNIVSDTDSTDDLGTNLVRWANLYVDNIACTSAIDMDGSITLTTDSTYNLGSNAVRWANAYIDDVTVTTSITTGGTITSGGNIVSDTDSTDDLGTNLVRWANLYVDDITTTSTITTGGTITSGGNIVSDTDSTDDLGTTSVRWANAYIDDVDITTSLIVNSAGGTATVDADDFRIGGTGGTAARYGMTILTDTTGRCGIYFGDGDNNSIGRIVYFHSSDAMQFVAGTVDMMYLFSDRLQINLATPVIEMGNGGPRIISGSGTPEGAVTADVGSMFMRTDGGAGTSLYVKESGTGNTGWVGK